MTASRKAMILATVLAAGLAAATCCKSVRAEGDPGQDLARYLGSELSVSEESVGESLAANGAPEDNTALEQVWYFKRLWLRARPRASFSVPGIAKLEVVPELELLFDRAYPDGWTSYKPSHQ
jgi:hypothetical protein